MRKKLKMLRSVGRPSAFLAPLKIICILSRLLRGIFNHCVEKLETRSNRKCNLLWPPFSCLVFRLFLLKEKGKEEGLLVVGYNMAWHHLSWWAFVRTQKTFLCSWDYSPTQANSIFRLTRAISRSLGKIGAHFLKHHFVYSTANR